MLTVAAVLGNVVGYGLGRLIGPPLFRERSGLLGQLFKPSYVEKTRIFLDRYGSRAALEYKYNSYAAWGMVRQCDHPYGAWAGSSCQWRRTTPGSLKQATMSTWPRVPKSS